MTTAKTPMRQLLDLKLDGGLDALVAARRSDDIPWRLIAREVYERTGIDITPQALRIWYVTDPAVA